MKELAGSSAGVASTGAPTAVALLAGAGVAGAAAAPRGGAQPGRCADAPAAGAPAAGAMRRVVVAREADVPDGELRQVKIAATPDGGGEGALLLIRLDGKFYATGASCSHYSAPLAQGVAAKDKMHVVCPWHDAAFDVRTGQPLRGPGMQAIPTYLVTVEDGEVIVEVPMHMEDFVKPTTVRKSPDDARVFVVIGGGAAGVAAADALRQEGYTGQIVLISEEKHLPYDRPVLSKNLAKAADPASLALRDDDYFAEHDIEFRRNTAVVGVDAQQKVVRLSGGEEIRYDAALVATGAKPRVLSIPGADFPDVYSLRTPEDAQRIAAACSKGKQVVVVGSSFIGMEVAATLKRRGCEVTVLGMEVVPFERVLGRRIGEAVKTLFESQGVKFIGSAVVNEIVQKAPGGGLVAKLKSGKDLPCDAVIVGVGVVPNAGFVTGAEKGRDGSLITDEKLQTSAVGLFAAGDVATYRSPHTGEALRVEHWDVATSQGRMAAKSMLGKPDVFDQTPFFWTSLFGKNLRYVGHCKEFDELMVDGDLQKLTFVAYYCHKGSVKAVATMSRDPVAVAAGELMRMGKMPSVEDLKAGRASAAGLAEELKRLSRAA